MSIRVWLVGLAPVVATAAMPVAAQRVTVPFTIQQLRGSRPVVAATIQGRPIQLVLHSNAGPYLQINHAEAKAMGAHDLVHRGAYGIASAGHVSDLGRDDGVVDRLAIGDWTRASVPVAVFETPAGGAQGMLGLPFLADAHVVLDYAERRATLSAAPDAALAAAMATRGYAPHAMTRDPVDGRYLMTVTINGVSAPMAVSTVATIDLDSGFAERATVALGAASGNYGGPSGATGNVYPTVQPVTIRIGDWTSRPVKVSVEDTYAYSGKAHPADPAQARGGNLGADFMLANRAVIDFGNAILYLPR